MRKMRRTDRSNQRRSPQHNWTPVGRGTEPTDERNEAHGKGGNLAGRGRAWDGRVKGYERGPLGMNEYVRRVSSLNDVAYTRGNFLDSVTIERLRIEIYFKLT